MKGNVKMVAIDPRNGRVLWRHNTRKNGIDSAAPTVAPDGTIYSFYKNSIYALNTRGKKKFRYEPEHWYPPEIVDIDNNGRAIITTNGKVIALSPQGKELWRRNKKWHAYSFTGDREHVYLYNDHELVALDSATGKTCWKFNPGLHNKDCGHSPLGLIDGKLFVTRGADQRTITCLDAVTGKMLWENRMQKGLSGREIILHEDNQLLTIRERALRDKKTTLSSLDLNTGKRHWSLDFEAGYVGKQKVADDGTLYVNASPHIYRIDAASGEIKSAHRTFDYVNEFFISDDSTTIFVQSWDKNRVAAIDTQAVNEEMKEKLKELSQGKNEPAAPGILQDEEIVAINGIRLEKQLKNYLRKGSHPRPLEKVFGESLFVSSPNLLSISEGGV